MSTTFQSPDPDFIVIEATDKKSIQAAVTQAKVTGSVGATYEETTRMPDGSLRTDGFAKVERVKK